MRGKLFKTIRTLAIVCGLSTAAQAGPVEDVMTTAQTAFGRMPDLAIVPDIAGQCGADATVNATAAYCTSTNRIYVKAAAATAPQTAYIVAHLLGHAVQVQHGVADIALREITRRRSEEQTLRTFVESQVDCIAGFLLAQAGQPRPDVARWFSSDPFAGPHWGRNPLNQGPQVTLTLALRAQWVETGYAASDLGACAVGEFGAELLIRAYRG